MSEIIVEKKTALQKLIMLNAYGVVVVEEAGFSARASNMASISKINHPPDILIFTFALLVSQWFLMARP